jgi:hypothetical protein
VDVLENDPNRAPRVAWFAGDELFYSTDSLKCYGELGYHVARTAIYSKPGLHCPLALGSTEHLVPVFLMWPSLRFDVHVAPDSAESPLAELPMMDGSALPFFHALRKVAGVPEPLRFYDAPVDFTLEFPRGRVSVSPSDTFEVEYEITRDDGFSSAATLAVYSAEDLYRAFSARTFIFGDDYAKARAQGLLAGVDETCGMLLGGAEPPRYRMAEEPACHKILDLLGDLAFAVPALPKVRIQILNGGHTIHHQIMEKLLPYVSTGNPQEV